MAPHSFYVHEFFNMCFGQNFGKQFAIGIVTGPGVRNFDVRNIIDV